MAISTKTQGEMVAAVLLDLEAFIDTCKGDVGFDTSGPKTEDALADFYAYQHHLYRKEVTR